MRRARRQEKAAAQREGPWTGAVQNESQLQEDTSKLAIGSAEGQAKSRVGVELVSSRFRSDVWQSGLRAVGPICPSLPWCFSPARAAQEEGYKLAASSAGRQAN